MPPVYGPMVDRLGARSDAARGWLLAALLLPVIGITSSFPTALAIIVVHGWRSR